MTLKPAIRDSSVRGGTVPQLGGWTHISLGLLSASNNFVSKSFGFTYLDLTTIVPSAIAIVTGSTIGVVSLSTTFVHYTTSAAGTQFYASVFGR